MILLNSNYLLWNYEFDMNFIRKILYKLLIILFVLITQNSGVYAQQSILNIPSVDVLPPYKTNLKSTFRFNGERPEFFNATPVVTQNIGYKTDVYFGVSVGQQRDIFFGNFDSDIDGLAGFKKGFDITSTTQGAIGSLISPSLQTKESPVNFSYVLLAQKIPATNTRITGGVYARSDNDQFFPDLTGALVGFEQAVIKDRLNILVDWTSGNRPFGILATGIGYTFKSGTTVKLGTLIPNGSNARFAYIISISKTFSALKKSK